VSVGPQARLEHEDDGVDGTADGKQSESAVGKKVRKSEERWE
jgi:hypothetical protein